MAASVITYAEACAALGRGAKTHGYDEASLGALVAALEAQWAEFIVAARAGARGRTGSR